MGETDPQHRIKLIVDEWGAWHTQNPMLPPGYLFGYPGTMRDAVVAGLTLDTFNRHADKVVMANVAQLINTIHSLFIAYEDKFTVTPNFHVFEMYAAHQGGQSVRTLFSSPTLSLQTEPSQRAARFRCPDVTTGESEDGSRGAVSYRNALGAARLGLPEGEATDSDRRESSRDRSQGDRTRCAGRNRTVRTGDDSVGQRYSRAQQFRESASAGTTQ